MCLYKSHWIPKIAWKPIKVYKKLRVDFMGGLRSPYFGDSQWKIGKMEWALMVLRNSLFSKEVNAGLHAYKTPPQYISTHAPTFEAIIPRFSFYFEDNYGEEIVSNRMKIIKKYEPNNV